MKKKYCCVYFFAAHGIAPHNCRAKKKQRRKKNVVVHAFLQGIEQKNDTRVSTPD